MFETYSWLCALCCYRKSSPIIIIEHVLLPDLEISPSDIVHIVNPNELSNCESSNIDDLENSTFKSLHRANILKNDSFEELFSLLKMRRCQRLLQFIRRSNQEATQLTGYKIY